MITVWHCCSLGNWCDIALDQIRMMAEVGLTEVHTTFLGRGVDWIKQEARRLGVNLIIECQDDNTDHYETKAMLYIERMAKIEKTDEPILYFHVKGCSNSGDTNKQRWRKLMEREVVRKWRENLAYLEDHDCVGVNWLYCDNSHFSGNFWLARADWIRQLPDYVAYHHSKNLERYSCEFWIGSTPGCKPKSLVCCNEPFWFGNYDWAKWGV